MDFFFPVFVFLPSCPPQTTNTVGRVFGRNPIMCLFSFSAYLGYFHSAVDPAPQNYLI